MNRIVQLDFFRGLFLIVMTADHFMSDNNIIIRFSREFIGWITAAEGFVFLSGFTAGLVYSNIYKKKGETALQAMAFRRSKTLYKYDIGMALGIMAAIYALNYMQAYWTDQLPVLENHPGSAAFLIPFFLFQPPLFDILPVYTFFFLFVPFFVRSFFTNKQRLVLGISLLVYLLGFFVFEKYFFATDFKKNYLPLILNPFTWQLLFVAGLYAGHLLYRGKLHAIKKQKTWFIAGLLLSAIFFVARNFHINGGIDTGYWLNKSNMGPLRVLNIAALTFSMAFIVIKFKRWFTFKPFCYLGKYSLEVFSFHIILFYFLRPFRESLNDRLTIAVHPTFKIYPYETAIMLLVLLSLFIAPWVSLKNRTTARVPQPLPKRESSLVD